MPKFVPRERKHKRRRKEDVNQSSNVAEDSNAPVVLPAAEAEKDEKRRQLREELRAQQPKISAKKQKRLNKYIENKLRKEENLELIKKLAAAKVDTTLLRSSRNLGASKESKREILSRALKERQAGINVEENNEALFETRKIRSEEDLESDSDTDGDVDISRASFPINAFGAPAVAVGSGLKRPLDVDEAGNPVIKRRKRKVNKPARIARFAAPDEPIWTGFSSDEELDIERESDLSGEESPIESDEDSPDGEDSDIDTSPGEGEASDEEYDIASKKERSSAFKMWATQQRNEALGFTPSGLPPTSTYLAQQAANTSFTPREPEQDPLPPELEIKTSTDATRKAFSVQVERPPEIQAQRLTLPVVAEEQKIMEAIHNNSTVVIWGATGSGKTTQVPQFLYESGYGSLDGPTPGMIGVTQPRRVAAVSMAKRVDEELGGDSGRVAYQIRFEGTVNDNTAIKFMTDGVLLREIGTDITLRKYSAIIIDEAHERTINTDILIGMMSRVVKLRESLSKEDLSIKPLKLIIMSATLRVSDFTDNKTLFSDPPPIIKAEGRQHPVAIHFSRKTERDYVEGLFKKLSRGHRKLPPGGMLVFLTGQNEIDDLSRKLKQAFGSKTVAEPGKRLAVKILGKDAPIEAEDVEFGDLDVLDAGDLDSESGSETGDSDDDMDLEEYIDSPSPMHILPLYSLLPTKDQLKVFEPPPDGARLVVLATNVAETSLTIPGIRYVFDCGRAKERKYDRTTGVQSFEISWISKASANQRAGRAGRVGPGHCYRLYSSAVYERDFKEYAKPEILRMPIEGVVLQLKSMNLTHVTNFPFPTPPERQSLSKAEKLLSYLAAFGSTGELTELGRTMSVFPLSPRFAKILIIGHQHGCLPYIIAIVAALSVGDVFIPEHQLGLGINPKNTEIGGDTSVFDNAQRLEEDRRDARRKAYFRSHKLFSRLDETCDALKLLSAICAYEHETNQESFCEANFLRLKALKETNKLRRQITDIVRTNCPGVVGRFEPKLSPPSSLQVKVIKQIIAAGFVDQVAIRADLAPNPPLDFTARKSKRAIDTPYFTLFPSSSFFTHQRGVDEDQPLDPAVYIHPSSVFATMAPHLLPPYIIYSHLQRSGTNVSKIRMKPLTTVSGSQLTALAHGTPLITYSKPIKESMPKEMERGKGEERRECWVVPTLGGAIGKAGVGWPLPAKKVVQTRVRGGGWVVVS